PLSRFVGLSAIKFLIGSSTIYIRSPIIIALGARGRVKKSHIGVSWSEQGFISDGQQSSDEQVVDSNPSS
ncbi:hypothetical protein A2U01_0045650, partial [Trifolium medium]|nr:hypothetical protein [Trifolium medium]